MIKHTKKGEKLKIEVSKRNPKIALVTSATPVITDRQSALDLMATVRYETECEVMIVEKSALPEEFFDLSTGFAGEILQKITQYRMVIAIAGDISGYESKALRDFVRECNRGRQVYFGASMEACEETLAGR